MMERLRAAWQVLRGYAAAQDHRASAWAPSGGSANVEVGDKARVFVDGRDASDRNPARSMAKPRSMAPVPPT